MLLHTVIMFWCKTAPMFIILCKLNLCACGLIFRFFLSPAHALPSGDNNSICCFCGFNFLRFYLKGMTNDVCLCAWLILLHMMSSKIIIKGRISFLLMSYQYPVLYMHRFRFFCHILANIRNHEDNSLYIYQMIRYLENLFM